MNALLPAHSRFGGSGAARVLGCPASVGFIEKVPPSCASPPHTLSAALRSIRLWPV
jgi:hypothetical protein